LLFPPCVTLRRVLHVARELTLSCDVVSAGSMPSGREDKMLGCVIISMTCGYSCLPTFVGRLGWGLSFLWLSLPHFAVCWRMVQGASNLSCARPHERGALSRDERDCATLNSLNRLTEKEITALAKLRYCERVHTHFPVVFAGEAYVGEGTVLNVSVPGCAVHSRKRVQPGSYIEMRMLVPDTTSPLRVGLAKVRWCEGRRFGVEFIQMPGEDQVRLGRLVKNEVPLALLPRSSAWQGAHS
jgi:hypothetical protein